MVEGLRALGLRVSGCREGVGDFNSTCRAILCNQALHFHPCH